MLVNSWLMAVAWRIVGSCLVWLWKESRGIQALALLLVISHWVAVLRFPPLHSVPGFSRVRPWDLVAPVVGRVGGGVAIA